MIIGIDGNEANVKNKVGTGQYTYYLLGEWHNQARETQQFWVYLSTPPREEMPKETKYFRYLTFGPKKFWTQLALPIKLFLQRQKPDVFFSPAHYAPRFCPMPSVVTIHDLAYLTHPQEFKKRDLNQLKSWTRYSVKKADRVIAVSKNTKKDLEKFYDVKPDKITVVYNGFDNNRFHQHLSKTKIKKTLSIYNISGDYLVFLGTLQPRKNVTSLIKAMPKITKEHPNVKLVVIGKKGWLYSEIFSLVEKLNLKDQVIFTGFVPDEDVPYLLTGAQLFVLPSLYEGFGITVLEAMAVGTPVMASHVSSLPEVVGEAGILIENPKNYAEIAQKANEVLENKDYANKLVEAGLKQSEKFSWTKCAKETLRVMTE